MRVDLKELAAALAYLKSINSCPLEQIEWTLGAKVVDVTTDEVGEWKFTGLNNSWFGERLVENVEELKFK